MERYLNIPWKKHSSGWDGCDCIGLVVLWYKNEYGIDFFKDNHPKYEYSTNSLNDAATNPVTLKYLTEVDSPKRGDVVVMTHGALSCHVGVYLGRNKILHVPIGRLSTVDDTRDLIIKNSIKAFYRHHEKN